MKFTDRYILNLKPADKMQDIREGDGFGVRVLPSGVKTFFYLYRFDGKRRFLNLGHYDPKATPGAPGTLAQARKDYIEAKNTVNGGVDPMATKENAARERRQAPTIADLCAEYMENHGSKKRSGAGDERMINVEILPKWSQVKAKDITKRDVNAMLEDIAKRAPIVSNRVRSLLSKLFNFALEREAVLLNPCLGVKAKAVETPRERALSETEILTLWRELGSGTLIMSGDVARVLKLILITAQRPGEVAGMHKNEIDGRWWTIPAARAKNKREHRVYLTDLALEIIGEPYGYVFPSPVQKIVNGEALDVPITESALSCAIRRNISGERYLRDKSKKVYKRGPYKVERIEEPVNRIGVPAFTPHDLRRTSATLMAKEKVLREYRERVLNHTLEKMDATYNQHDYDDVKQAALETLERKIKRVLAGKEQDNVVDINSARGKAA